MNEEWNEQMHERCPVSLPSLEVLEVFPSLFSAPGKSWKITLVLEIPEHGVVLESSGVMMCFKFDKVNQSLHRAVTAFDANVSLAINSCVFSALFLHSYAFVHVCFSTVDSSRFV